MYEKRARLGGRAVPAAVGCAAAPWQQLLESSQYAMGETPKSRSKTASGSSESLSSQSSIFGCLGAPPIEAEGIDAGGGCTRGAGAAQTRGSAAGSAARAHEPGLRSIGSGGRVQPVAAGGGRGRAWAAARTKLATIFRPYSVHTCGGGARGRGAISQRAGLQPTA